jgi:hypothetical protein
MLSVLGGARQWSKKQFCSRLVAQSFAAAGIKLVADPNFCSPADIQASPLLVVVADATVPVTAEEEAWWEDTEDVPQRMRDAINAFLDGARTKDPSIETFDDIHIHLARHVLRLAIFPLIQVTTLPRLVMRPPERLAISRPRCRVVRHLDLLS